MGLWGSELKCSNKKNFKRRWIFIAVFLTACSWAKQLLSPGTHSTFIWIMEKETQFRRCFSGVQRGDFDPSSDNSCPPWEGFLVALSLRPGKSQGRCLVDLKAQPSNRYLREGLWVGKGAWHRVLSFCQSLSWLDTEHTGKGLLKGIKSHLDFPHIVKLKEGRKPKYHDRF